MKRQREDYASWFAKRKPRRLRDELRECRELDAARTAAGTQNQWLNEQMNPPEPKRDWRDRYFKK